jgi:hypothetical protein
VDRVLTQNGLKLIFYPSQRGLTRIPPWTWFWLETTWNSFFTPVDMVWLGGLGFDWKWWLRPKIAWNSFFTLVDMVWHVFLHGHGFDLKW